MNYINYGRVEIYKCIKVLQHFRSSDKSILFIEHVFIKNFSNI